MSYTNPHGHPQGLPGKVTNLLRQVMIAEIVAINGYQKHILSSNIAAVNEAWYHIMLEEKSHYIIALDLLRKYDTAEYNYFMTPHEINPGPETGQNSVNIQKTQNIQLPSNTPNTSNTPNHYYNIQKLQNTNPNTAHNSGKKSSASSQQNRIITYDKLLILNNIRDDIKGELEAVILYEDEIAHIQQKDIRQALQKIIDDEKEHTEHLTQVLFAFDSDPYKA
ncbi:hypothetical protein CLHUN_34640 [Ruminiclostridium hungatei]|uniref:Rubrerythrin n=1 Tax=Ruminiclostridium hungatei TaxID=48256 RepID=A0A1V4SFE8_RUMHU|nr:ferritin-like domain-containing protein [Ruminiclostridium hungatei]OPX42642.1 hypothetical protein CLHUN_34640 [Ruminiclostridium hungatei]